MNLFSILIKLWPAIKDTLLGGLNLSFYLKRNRAITMLCIALAISCGCFFYMYEQAFMHGAVSRSLQEEVASLKKASK
jgi:Trk-type K+ transport system membrane component